MDDGTITTSLTVELRGANGDTHCWMLNGPGPHLIGRSDTAEIRVPDLRVSREHARLFVEGGGWVLEAVTEHQATWVDGKPVTRLAISDRIAVTLGDRSSADRLLLMPVAPSAVRANGETSSDENPSPAAQFIGRGRDNDLVLEELLVSRRHAKAIRENGTWAITDLSSHIGTFVNGSRITGVVPLSENDRVTIGSAELKLTNHGLVPVERRAEEARLAVNHLGTTVNGSSRILDDVTFNVMAGEFLAIVGPTGSGKSTLLKSITGFRLIDDGEVLIDGHNLYDNIDELRPRIGYVPQDDILHPQLTIRRALQFGAELRFPEETTTEERGARVDEVMVELGLSERANLSIEKLSGGQRKRTSVALELLTKPQLVFLDEPTSGLDPGYEQSVMQLLRSLASDGRVVIVVTHSLASLDLCDNVLFLRTGGHIAYFGPSSSALAHFGESDFRTVFRSLEHRVQTSNGVSRGSNRMETHRPAGVALNPAAGPSWRRQLSTLLRRQFAILGSDRRNLLVLAIASLIPAMLVLALTGRGALAEGATPKSNARTLLGALIISAAAIGASNGLREIVKERAIYLRERAIGLSRSAYLVSKVLGLGAITTVQCCVLTIIGTLAASGPDSSNVLPPMLELIVDVSLAGIVSLGLGLLVSAIVSSSEKAMTLIPVVFVVSWLFSGIAFDLGSKPVLDQASYLVPANWGVSAAASTSNLPMLENYICKAAPSSSSNPAVSSANANVPASNTIAGGETSVPPDQRCDSRWHHGVLRWVEDVVALVLLGAAFVLGADWALARKEPLPVDRSRFLLSDAIGRLRERFR